MGVISKVGRAKHKTNKTNLLAYLKDSCKGEHICKIKSLSLCT